MSDLETKLAEARERLALQRFLRRFRVAEKCENTLSGFDVAANIAREVVAEKDAEIARLEASRLDNSTWLLADKPRKVTDAQIKALAGPMGRVLVKLTDEDIAKARAEIMPNDVSEMAASHRRAFDAGVNLLKAGIVELKSALGIDSVIESTDEPAAK